GLIGAAPALLRVDPAAQRVHDGVQVGADVQAEQVDVVAGVADDRDLSIWRSCLQAAQEAGAAHAARENCDAHVESLATGPAGASGEPPGTCQSRAGLRAHPQLRPMRWITRLCDDCPG